MLLAVVVGPQGEAGAMGRANEGMRRWALVGALALAGCAIAAPSGADTFQFTIRENGRTLGGQTFDDGDIVSFDDVTGSASILLSESLFGGGAVEVDAVHLLSDGRVALSIAQNNRTLGGLTFDDGDVVVYDPADGLASMLIQESVLSSGDVDIDAFHLLDNGNFLLSIKQNDRVIGGLTVSDGDVIEYDPTTNTATLRLAEAAWGQGVEVDGVSQLGNSLFITVANNGSRTLGGATISDGDILRYDEASGVGSVFFAGSVIGGGGVDLDGVSVPEPDTFALLSLGLAGLAVSGRPRRRPVSPPA